MSQETSALIAQVLPVFLLVVTVRGGIFHKLMTFEDPRNPEGTESLPRLFRAYMTYLYMVAFMAAETLAIFGGGGGGLNRALGAALWGVFGMLLLLTAMQVVIGFFEEKY